MLVALSNTSSTVFLSFESCLMCLLSLSLLRILSLRLELCSRSPSTIWPPSIMASSCASKSSSSGPSIADRGGATSLEFVMPQVMLSHWSHSPKNHGSNMEFDTMITSLAELPEEKGSITQEEWEQKIQKNLKA